MKKLFIILIVFVCSLNQTYAYPNLIITPVATPQDSVYAGDTSVVIARWSVKDTSQKGMIIDSLEYSIQPIIPLYIFPFRNVKIFWDGVQVNNTIAKYDTANHYFAGHYYINRITINDTNTHYLEIVSDIPEYNFPFAQPIKTSLSDLESWHYAVFPDAESPVVVAPKPKQSVGVQDVKKIAYRVFPNPAINEVNIALEKSTKVMLLNPHGQVISSAIGKNIVFRRGSLPSGFYFITGEAIKTERIIFR